MGDGSVQRKKVGRRWGKGEGLWDGGDTLPTVRCQGLSPWSPAWHNNLATPRPEQVPGDPD